MQTLYRSNPIQLGEAIFVGVNEIREDIQVLRVGTFFHENREIEITKSHLKSMVTNFKENVRGIDIMLDYSHDSHKEAAAWFQDLYLSEDGKELWAKVDWTESGSESVRKKEYRYISADFNFAYKDNESLREFGPTLLGAGLTNRPVVKNMEPVILSESKNQYKEEKEMSESLEEMKKKLAQLEEENRSLKDKLKSKDDKMSEEETQKKEQELADREEKVRLAEEKIEEDKKLAEKKAEFDGLLKDGKACEAQRESFMEGNMVEYAKKAEAVNLSERGSSNTSTNNNYADSDTPAQDEVLALAEKKASENKTSVDVEIEAVLSENSKLREKYEKEVAL